MNCEIEFLPVGSGSKPGDAIVVRYGSESAYDLMVVDGGTLATGKDLVTHLRSNFGTQVVVNHVLLTHSDADHASGLRTLLEEVPVRNLWLHVPWLHAAASKPYFANKSWTTEGLAAAISEKYDLVSEIVNLASANKIPTYEPFAEAAVGPFQVLSPYRYVYELFLPQFDRTPEPDRAAIEAKNAWVGEPPSSLLAQLLEKAATEVQKWVAETWTHERLKDGGVTSASNESSVILYGTFEQGSVLLTGDAGIWALTMAAERADAVGIPLQNFSFVQIPHHGSRRNVGPTILNRLLGPIRAEGSASKFHAFVSAPPDDDTHPRKMVTNAFWRRGGAVRATQGQKKVFYGGFSPRSGYGPAPTYDFATQVEEYD